MGDVTSEQVRLTEAEKQTLREFVFDLLGQYDKALKTGNVSHVDPDSGSRVIERIVAERVAHAVGAANNAALDAFDANLQEQAAYGPNVDLDFLRSAVHLSAEPFFRGGEATS